MVTNCGTWFAHHDDLSHWICPFPLWLCGIDTTSARAKSAPNPGMLALPDDLSPIHEGYICGVFPYMRASLALM